MTLPIAPLRNLEYLPVFNTLPGYPRHEVGQKRSIKLTILKQAAGSSAAVSSLRNVAAQLIQFNLVYIVDDFGVCTDCGFNARRRHKLRNIQFRVV